MSLDNFENASIQWKAHSTRRKSSFFVEQQKKGHWKQRRLNFNKWTPRSMLHKLTYTSHVFIHFIPHTTSIKWHPPFALLSIARSNNFLSLLNRPHFLWYLHIIYSITARTNDAMMPDALQHTHTHIFVLSECFNIVIAIISSRI